jgi:hypothetical protein
MDQSELKLWLDALGEQGLIEEWHWTLHVEPGEPAAISYLIDGISYLIDGSSYTLEGAVKLVRDFEAAVVG